MNQLIRGEEIVFDTETAETTTKPIEISIDTDKVKGFAMVEFGEREMLFKVEDVKRFFAAIYEEYKK